MKGLQFILENWGPLFIEVIIFLLILYFFKYCCGIVPSKTKGVAHGYINSMVNGLFNYNGQVLGNVGINLCGVNGWRYFIGLNGLYG